MDDPIVGLRRERLYPRSKHREIRLSENVIGVRVSRTDTQQSDAALRGKDLL
jgi:hypothetical protein